MKLCRKLNRLGNILKKTIVKSVIQPNFLIKNIKNIAGRTFIRGKNEEFP